MSATGGERVCEKMIAEHCVDIALSVLNKVPCPFVRPFCVA